MVYLDRSSIRYGRDHCRYSTKFYHLVGPLDMEILDHVSDQVAAPPSQSSYEALQQRIIES